jgi:hypothetical protein
LADNAQSVQVKEPTFAVVNQERETRMAPGSELGPGERRIPVAMPTLQELSIPALGAGFVDALVGQRLFKRSYRPVPGSNYRSYDEGPSMRAQGGRRPVMRANQRCRQFILSQGSVTGLSHSQRDATIGSTRSARLAGR